MFENRMTIVGGSSPSWNINVATLSTSSVTLFFPWHLLCSETFSVSCPPSSILFLLLCELPPFQPCVYVRTRSERIVLCEGTSVIGVWPILRTAEHVHSRDVSTYLPTPRGIELPPRAPMWQLSYLTYRLGNCIDTFFFNGGVPQAGGPGLGCYTGCQTFSSRMNSYVCVCVRAPLAKLVDSSRSELIGWLRQEAGLETRG